MPAQNQPTQTAQTLRLPDWLRIVLIGRNPKVTLARIAVLIVSCFIIFKFILFAIRAEGISMLPTYQDGSIHLMSRVAYLWHEPQRGDVVSIRLAGAHMMYMKRIIGLPGETIAFANGQVLINGQTLDEPYIKFFCDWNLPPEKLGPDEYYVVGDNRTMPPQYHEHGIAKRDRIFGKLLL
ncbi:MAG: signal peptidase I [Verrucomicrobiota bacterium]|jgi:signal peptidase I